MIICFQFHDIIIAIPWQKYFVSQFSCLTEQIDYHGKNLIFLSLITYIFFILNTRRKCWHQRTSYSRVFVFKCWPSLEIYWNVISNLVLYDINQMAQLDVWLLLCYSIYATFRFCQVSTFLILFSGFKQKEALSLSVKSSLRAYVCMHACCF